MDFNEHLGSIMLFSGSTNPPNWVNCEGQTLQIAEYQALFTIVGDKYGGDRRKTFGLPKLSNIGPARYIICKAGRFPVRD